MLFDWLIVGQVLVLPGAKGAPIPTPTPKPTRRPSSGGSGGSGGGFVYVSGPWAWPVPGGYISQYFHYGHYAIDIAADYGSTVRAAAAGTVEDAAGAAAGAAAGTVTTFELATGVAAGWNIAS